VSAATRPGEQRHLKLKTAAVASAGRAARRAPGRFREGRRGSLFSDFASARGKIERYLNDEPAAHAIARLGRAALEFRYDNDSAFCASAQQGAELLDAPTCAKGRN